MLGSIGKALNSLTGASASQSKAHQSSKSLANLSYEQQKEFAKNAHQWEMEDLKKAGLNPALTTGASSAGAIAGGGATGQSGAGSHGGLDLITTLANVANTTRKTSADIKNEGKTAEAALKTANANEINAQTNKKVAEGGAGGRFFGSDAGGLLSSLATAILPIGGLGLASAGIKGFKAYKAMKLSKNFGNFIKAVSSAK